MPSESGAWGGVEPKGNRFFPLFPFVGIDAF
jgi:hypothetical protein